MSKTALGSEASELLFALHFRKVFRKAVALANLKGSESVLDFGCGTKHLKRLLPAFTHYIGFDVNPERSDVVSFGGRRFDAIFAVNVLEHLSEEELAEVFPRFRATGASRLVVSLPSENALFNLFAFFIGGHRDCFWYHKTSSKRVAFLLLEEFGFPLEIGSVDGLKQLAVFRVC